MIINQCLDCSGVLTDQGIIWQCDSIHPEVLAQQEQQELQATSRDEAKQQKGK